MKTESNLEKVFNAGHFAVTGELGPPKSANLETTLHHAEEMRNHVDAYNITDNQTAIVRTSSIGVAAHLIQRGLDPVVQMTCRDRNRICLQADLLGAVSFGARNFLCLQGDHGNFGNEGGCKNVNDLDSTQLLQAVKNMRDDGEFVGGDKLDHPLPKVFIGAVANPFADPFEYRALRLGKKIAAGAEFVQTQCIFDLERFEKWMELVRELGLHKKVKIMGGVTPIKSVGMARYMQKNVSGMIVPEDVIQRVKGAEDKKKEGLKIAIETIKRLQEIEGVAGVHVMAIAWEEVVPEIVDSAGLYPRPEVE